MECPFRSNGDIRIFAFTQRKWRRTYVTFTQRWWRHTWYLCDIRTKKNGTVPLKKRSKKVWQPHNIRVMYEIIRNKAVFILSKWKNIVWQSHKIKRDNSTGKLKDICGSPQGRMQLSYLEGGRTNSEIFLSNLRKLFISV